MERADWLDEGFDTAQARFLMVTAITHHEFSSSLWGEDEVCRLQAELAEIDTSAEQVETEYLRAQACDPSSLARSAEVADLWLFGDEELPGLWGFFN